MPPLGEVYLLEGKAIEWPEECSRLEPHPVEDEMGECAERENEEPGLSMLPIEEKPGKGDKHEE